MNSRRFLEDRTTIDVTRSGNDDFRDPHCSSTPPLAVVVSSDLLKEAAEARDEEDDESDDYDEFQFHFGVGCLHASMKVDFCCVFAKINLIT